MEKIITLFQRNYETDRLVRNEVTPGAEWVMEGEGVPTRKLDGTACLVREGKLYKRYELKRGKPAPPDFEPAQEPDAVTGDTPGWVPVGDGPEDRWHREAWTNGNQSFPDGTYELLGPKVQGNAEHQEIHRLVPHGQELLQDVPRDYAGLKDYLAAHELEGIVWWRDRSNPACEKVKLKRRDFGLPWPVKC
jgi:hypothetical protein